MIESYSADGFRVSGIIHKGAILVLPRATLAWPVVSMADVSLASLAPILGADLRVLLLGCGRRMALVPADLRQALRQREIVIDAMDSGAACRTYNVLLAEDRRVAAALLPPR
ncbi:MAG TPA: Mth938-like domain-containing protein [Stellaceae bacterium]|nr:Mth938-like domain-containing protein [Stellaceae bacterium]